MSTTSKKVLEDLFKSENVVADFKEKDTGVIPTGSYLLNDALGCGGYPNGRISQLYGPAGSGKTLMAMLAIREAQRQHPTAEQVFLDLENTFDDKWAVKLGIDMDRVRVIQHHHLSFGTFLFKSLWGSPKKDTNGLEKSHPGLFDRIASKELNANLVVLDSLGYIIPPSEASAEVGAIKMAPLPRFLAVELKKLSPDVTKSNVPFLIINHVTASMDQYAPEYTYSGGNKYTHSLSLNLFVEKVNRKDSFILGEHEDKVGHTIRAKIEKNKMAMPHAPIELQVHYEKGVVNYEQEITKLAERYKIINRPNNVMYEYGDKKWRGADAFAEELKSNISFANELLKKIDEKRGGKITSFPLPSPEKIDTLSNASNELSLDDEGGSLDELLSDSKKKKSKK